MKSHALEGRMQWAEYPKPMHLWNAPRSTREMRADDIPGFKTNSDHLENAIEATKTVRIPENTLHDFSPAVFLKQSEDYMKGDISTDLKVSSDISSMISCGIP